jgi:branched-chain amino acid transport system ATP-binding protein
MTALLEIRNVGVQFGGVQALADVGFAVTTGEFLSLIGPNGAGKTTLLRCITGVVRRWQGQIIFSGRDISSWPIHRRIQAGLAMTHQIVRPFHSMTVLDNVALAAGHDNIRHVVKALLHHNRTRAREKALEWLSLVGIADVAHQSVQGLPLGVVKRLELARALALNPELLLLDEPLAGLNSQEAARLADMITGINQQGITVLMIEHNLGEVLRVSQRLVVLDNGRKIADGHPDKVMADPVVRSAYVGKEKSNAAA